MFERLQLPQPVLYAMERIIENGGEAWLVGGALRDFLLKRSVSDFDIATSFTPEKIKDLFSNYKLFTAGKRFGTITVIVDNMPIEITTFRGESDYTDKRHPDKVVFLKNIEDDLARRDFTINAMAYSPYSNPPFIDPFNGEKALENKIIKTVNDPYERFSEDPLRMLRAIRFSAQLGFDIETETFNAIKKLNHLILSISSERIRDEIFKILEAPFPDIGLKFFNKTGMLSLIIQRCMEATEFQGYSSNKSYECSCGNSEDNIHLDYSFLNSCPDNLEVKMGAFLYHELSHRDLNIQELSQRILKSLKCDNNFKKKTLKLIYCFDMLKELEPTGYNVRKLISSSGTENIYNLLEWYSAYSSFIKFNYNDKDLKKKIECLYKITDSIVKNKDPVKISDLAISGNDIKQMGIGLNDGRVVGEALNTALEWVLSDPALNKKDILTEKLLNRFNSKKD